MKRRNFIGKSSQTGTAFSLLGMYACKEIKKKEEETMEDANLTVKAVDSYFKLSLAQWSIHKMIKEDGVDPYTFAENAQGGQRNGLIRISL